MDNGTLFGVLSLVLLVMFVGAWIWIWRPSRREFFEAAARLPLEESTERNEESTR